jgi:hypothetical protein
MVIKMKGQFSPQRHAHQHGKGSTALADMIQRTNCELTAGCTTSKITDAQGNPGSNAHL